MKKLSQFLVALGVVLLGTSSGLARTAAIQARAPLGDHSEASIAVAVDAAVEAAVRRAVAMGLPHVELHGALLFDDAVVIEVLATDTEGDDQEQDGSTSPRDSGARPLPAGGESL